MAGQVDAVHAVCVLLTVGARPVLAAAVPLDRFQAIEDDIEVEAARKGAAFPAPPALQQVLDAAVPT